MKFRSITVAALVLSLLTLPLAVLGQKQKVGGIAERSVRRAESLKIGEPEALSDGNGVYLKWNTEYEKGNLGFEVFRLSAGKWEKITKNIIPGGYFRLDSDSTYGREYSYFDPHGSFGSAYFVRSLDTSGRTTDSRYVYPKFESDLSAETGLDSESLREGAETASPVWTKESPVYPKEYGTGSELTNLPPDLNKQYWVAAQPGVKIRVSSEGIYRVSRTELQNAGFDVNTDHTQWQLFLNGNEQGMIVEDSGNYIEFYGKGIDTPWTGKNVYFLIAGNTAGKRMRTAIRRGFGGNVEKKSFDHSFYRRDRSLYVAPLLNGDRENYYGAVIGSAGADINFTLKSIDYASPKTTIILHIQGFSINQHTVVVSVNGEVIEPINGTFQNLMRGEIGVPTALLVEGNNVIRLTATAPGYDLNLFESIEVRYARKYVADQNQLSFFVSNLKASVIGGFTDQNVRVFDMTFPDSPALLTNLNAVNSDKLGANYEVSIPANRAAPMIAVGDSAIKTVDSITPNVPSSVSSTSNQGRVLILTYKDWMTQANDWAAYRANEGFSTFVADVEDVFDEFAFGRPDANGLRSFLQYAQQNWATPPEYVLLLGDSSYDPRNYLGSGFYDFVPTKLVDTTYEETGSDEALADFNNDGLSELAIGRVPARNPQQVTDVLNKVTAFESTVANAPARGSLCASDLPDGYDFQALCQRVQGELPASIPTSYVNRGDANSKSALLSSMNAGKYVINYSGHGSTNVWAATSFFGNSDVASLTNVNDLSIFTMLTCLNGYFVHPTNDSLGERLLRATNGGAVATWSSSGKTTPDVQEILARRFYNQLGAGSMDRLGDLVRDAKSNIIGGRDVRLSWALLGDPVLKVK